ncbi:hypothetical protein DL96DRAFT_1610065 [Flagelloscypha sp. PMI_526]|nr:hypothetical protein DL96DRAFT_1610065 [Flagelloscypha sp. PMI_526]
MSLSSNLDLGLDRAFLESTFGALFIGFSISCLLFGVLSIQLYLYLRRFSAHGMVMTSIVAGMGILQFLHQIFIGHCSYSYVILMWGRPSQATTTRAQWSLVALIGTVVKVAYTWRVWRLSRGKRWLTAAIASTVLLQFMYAKQAASPLPLPSWASQGQGKGMVLIPQVTLAMVTSSISDVVIRYFNVLDNPKEGKAIVNGLVVYGLSTGFVSGILTMIVVILYNVRPNTFEFIAMYFILSKALSISLMTSLSLRKPPRLTTRLSQSRRPDKWIFEPEDQSHNPIAWSPLRLEIPDLPWKLLKKSSSKSSSGSSTLESGSIDPLPLPPHASVRPVRTGERMSLTPQRYRDV